jgi:lysophospholipase L1-like esterase
MATADRIPQPLRSLAGARARWFDGARARTAAAHPHVRSVDVASPPPGLTRRSARAHLCADRFHPGPLGYRVWAERIAIVAHEILESPSLESPSLAGEGDQVPLPLPPVLVGEPQAA